MKETGLLIIGGGPAGLAAANAAYDAGVRDLLLVERNPELGGILNQCIHAGFGLHRFGRELTGPEYAAREIAELRSRGIRALTGTTVTSLSPDRTVGLLSPELGATQIRARAVILAMGCRERPRGALNLPGTRPAGIYTAGCAQQMVNRMGLLPGRRVVILGSGDIGLIMARRMTLEGAKVEAVCEVMAEPGGLARNLSQCLDDFGIPLLLSTTVVGIRGEARLEAVTVASVDPSRRPVPGTEREIPCDTLLLSVGLIPENELSRRAGVKIDPATGGAVVNEYRETSVPGIFSCGNVLDVHDLADAVSDEAGETGRAAAAYLAGTLPTTDNPIVDNPVSGAESQPGAGKSKCGAVESGASSASSASPAFAGSSRVVAGAGVRFVVPQVLSGLAPVSVSLRVTDSRRDAELVAVLDGQELVRRKMRRVAPGEMIDFAVPARSGAGEVTVSLVGGTPAPVRAPGGGRMTCTVCPVGCELAVSAPAKPGGSPAVTGNRCPRGEAYAKSELVAPVRTLTTTIRTTDGRILPVRAATPVPRAEIPAVMRRINRLHTPDPSVIVTQAEDTGNAGDTRDTRLL